jgi:hypothetical protein
MLEAHYLTVVAACFLVIDVIIDAIRHFRSEPVVSGIAILATYSMPDTIVRV